jgi:hypothetical protein
MKKIIGLPLLLLLLYANTSSVFYTGDWYGGGEYTPVLMEREELERSVSYRAGGRDLVNPGKIYLKAPYIYINERYKGVHVINNADPAHPVKEGFIIAPGCMDMAVRGNIMYLDNAVDLVAFDLKEKTVAKRISGVFPEPVAPDNSYYYFDRPENFIITGWKKTAAND